jgi:RNA polymerase sigma factor (sigma-70 family)
VDTLDTAIDAAGHHHGRPSGDAAVGVTELYGAHAVAMIRIALLMLGDRAAAEDVVQDAFFGLYRRWSKLADPANALTYVRSAVLNGCRDTLRRQARRDRRDRAAARSWQDVGSAEALALISEDHRRILVAVRRLPGRQHRLDHRLTTSSDLHFGVVSDGRYTPLPTPPGVSLTVPPDIAW